MQEKIDISDNWIFENVPIWRVLLYYGIFDKFQQIDGDLVGPCPLHSECGKKSLRVNMLDNQWICRGIDMPHGGDVIDLIKDFEGVTQEAARRLILQRWIG